MRTRIFVLFSFSSVLIFQTLCRAQCISTELISPDTICIGENVYISTAAAESISYDWDLCPGRLDVSPNFVVAADNDVLDSGIGLDIVQINNSWQGYFVKSATSELYKINFGDQLTGVPSFENLGNPNNLLDQPYDIEIFREGSKWYGLIVNRRNSTVVKLTFTDDLSAVSSSEVIGSLTQVINPTAIEAIQSDALHVILTNGNAATGSVVYLNFGKSINNTPTETKYNVPGSQRLEGISIVQQDCNHYVGLISSNDNKQIYALDFENGFSNNPALTKLNIEIQRAAHLQMIIEKGIYYAIVQTKLGNIFRVKFTDPQSSSAQVTNLGRSQRYGYGFDLVREGKIYHGFAINQSSGKLVRLSFPFVCSSPVAAIDSTSLPVFSYNEAGTYFIDLNQTNQNGNSYNSAKIIVQEDQAPQINLTSMKGACVMTEILYTGESVDSISIGSWQWNFGDGSPVVNGQEVTHQYNTPGTYEVTLNIESVGGCGNRLTKEITIYEPPSPNFSVPPGQICTNGSVSLTNTTDAKGADSLITYQWFLDGELVSEAASPEIIFTEGGTKTLQLAASIPGCTETLEQTIDVLQGPTVSFSLPPQFCEGETIILDNKTMGDNITNYQWSFGDGGSLETIAAEAVSYTFAEAGTYDISLTANTSLGCANVSTQTVIVYEQPTVGFSSDVACVGAITQFTDTSTAGSNANIIAWNWDFGDGVGVADERNPAYIFSAPGTYTVELTTQSSGGCTATATQTITVETSVTTAFTADRVCPSDINLYLYQFTDESTVTEGETISQRLWTINGENFVDEAVTYAFTEPGTYDVSLTSFASSGCNATYIQTVTVDPLPEIRFQAASSCVGEPVQLTNISQLNGWELTQYTWSIPEVGMVFEQSPTVIFPKAGEFSVVLSLETENGCTFSWDSAITIVEAPQAVFEIDQLSGGAPLTIQPINQSTSYTRSRWSVNGSQTSEQDDPTFTLEEFGTYEIELIVENEVGCADTVRQFVEVVNPRVDLSAVELVQVANSSSSDQLVLTLENRGTVAIDTVEILLSLGNVVSLKEQMSEPLLPGERRAYPLKTTLGEVRNQQTPVEFICATVNAVSQSVSETNLSDNRACIALTAPVLIEAPFPNPARDEVILSVVLEEPETIQIDVIAASGERVHSEQITDTQSGLNTIRVNVSQTPPGIFTVEVQALGQTIIRRLIISP